MKNEELGYRSLEDTVHDNDEERVRRTGGYSVADPDPMFDDDSVDWTPERQMMLAILEDAVACFRKTLKRPRQNPDILARQAEFWIRLDEWNSPFSFNNICEALNMDPASTRELILSSRPSDQEKAA